MLCQTVTPPSLLVLSRLRHNSGLCLDICWDEAGGSLPLKTFSFRDCVNLVSRTAELCLAGCSARACPPFP